MTPVKTQQLINLQATNNTSSYAFIHHYKLSLYVHQHYSSPMSNLTQIMNARSADIQQGWSVQAMRTFTRDHRRSARSVLISRDSPSSKE